MFSRIWKPPLQSIGSFRKKPLGHVLDQLKSHLSLLQANSFDLFLCGSEDHHDGTQLVRLRHHLDQNEPNHFYSWRLH